MKAWRTKPGHADTQTIEASSVREAKRQGENMMVLIIRRSKKSLETLFR